MLHDPPRILIVEDEAIVALDLRTQLAAQGYEVVGPAATFDDALAAAAAWQPDLVLMDIHLQRPGDGIDAAERIRIQYGIPVVFLTAYADQATVQQARQVEPYGYLVKPFSERDLSTMVQVALFKGRADRAARQHRDDLTAILDAQRHGTLLTDAAGRILFLSRVARQLTGAGDDACGRPWQELPLLAGAPLEALREAVARAELGRTKTAVTLAPAEAPPRHLEVEIVADPRGGAGRFWFLYDVSEVYQLRRRLDQRAHFEGMVGKSKAIERVFQLVDELAQVDCIVLIEGESGVGKELVARAIHHRSRRRGGPLVPLNCAGLSDDLAASQLFGHRRGAFTGAVDDRAGLFEAAEGGVLLLDEIGELPLRVQTTLLRVLEERAVMRLGETQLRPVNARIIASTNRNLTQEVAEGRFRADLYYRIRVARVALPPLRERREDIPLLARHFVQEHQATTGRQIDAIDDEAMALLVAYSWPGNVRELKNSLEFAVIRCRTGTIQPWDLPPEITGEASPPGGATAEDERARVLRALEQAGGNRKAAADLLGVSRATLYRRLTQLGISAES